MTIVRVTRKLHFSAGHRLFREEWDDEENRRVFGACSNPAGHGHNYDLEVTVEGELDPDTGFVIDLKRLKELVNGLVVEDVDHANLNEDVPWLEDVIPTAEILAVKIWERIEGRLDGAELVSVRLWETERNVAEYRGE